jgi:hypothetical protein
MAEFDLSKKVGPLPMGAWGVVIAGGLGVGYMINKNMAKSAAEAANAPKQYAESDVGEGGSQLVFTPPVTVTQPDAEELTNALWGQKATNWLVSARGYDGVAADEAIRKYLSALPLSPVQRQMVNEAISKFGVPPEALPPSEQPPPTTPKPPSTPAVKPPPVSGLSAHAKRRAVTFTWNYGDVPIGGFRVTIKDLKRGTFSRGGAFLISAKARSYTFVAPRSWNSRTKSKVQISIRPFKGGWSVLNKVYGDSREVGATPII